ncbi:MAG: hypothetical protein AAGA08_11755 [Pseudomonadota bacterium]
MLDALKSKAACTAKRAGLLSGGLLMLSVGTAFLTVAAWIYLTSLADALTAATVIGAVYCGLGFVLFGWASTGTGRTKEHTVTEARSHATTEHHPPLMQAFLHGMQAGVNATHHR